ncbi:MAG: cytidine deaminase [Actinobacteria bacterium]|nr:cytidine deaminase [Actinomycetota bacterium]
MTPEASGDAEDDLVARARAARSRAYAPYSHFSVGAAIRAAGDVFVGANVENASYGLGICAERVAAATAVASGCLAIDAVAVVSSAVDPTPPCGACRQFLYEFNPEMLVVSEGAGGERRRWRLSELLVDGFGPADLHQPRIGEEEES